MPASYAGHWTLKAFITLTMTPKKRKAKITISTSLIAPCGMNCRLCLGQIREKNTCPGCRSVDNQNIARLVELETVK